MNRTLAAHSPSFLAGLKSGLIAAIHFLATHSAGAAALREAERLESLSDAQLAQLGLTRDRIIAHAFRRHLI